MGLSISDTIIESLGGTLGITSKFGKGTTVTISLNVETARKADSERPYDGRGGHSGDYPKDHAQAPVPGRKVHKLLVMDDEVLLVKSIGAILGKEAIVIPAYSVAQARSQLNLHQDIDGILADVVMPDGGAAALYDIVSDEWSHLTANFGLMTGMATPSSLPLGAESLPRLNKLFERDLLRSAVRRICARGDAESQSSPVVYELDANNTLVRVNREWDLFADANGSPEVFGRAVLGRNIDDFISDKTTRDLYQQIFTKVRETQKPVSFDYRCDSPKVMRFITMTVTPGREGHVLCTNSTTEIRPVKQTNIPVPASPSMPRAVPRCSVCTKVKWDDVWMPVDEAFTKGLELDDGARFSVYYQICPTCHADLQKRLKPGNGSVPKSPPTHRPKTDHPPQKINRERRSPGRRSMGNAHSNLNGPTGENHRKPNP